MIFADSCSTPDGPIWSSTLQHRRNPRRQVPGQRRDSAGAARQPAALSLPLDSTAGLHASAGLPHRFQTHRAAHPFWQISNDGNLLPKPLQVRRSPWALPSAPTSSSTSRQYAGQDDVPRESPATSRTARADQPDRFQPQAGLPYAARSWWTVQRWPTTASIRQRSPALLRAAQRQRIARVTRNFDFDQARNGQWTVNRSC